MINKDVKRTSLIIFISVAIISGIIYYSLMDEPSKINIANMITNQFMVSSCVYNNLLIHLIMIIIIIILSYFIFGIILIPFWYFIEFFTIGFSIATFVNIYKVNGLIYSLIFNIIGKMIYLIILLYLFKYLFKIALNNYQIIFKKKTFSSEMIKPASKKIGIYTFIIITNDLILKIFGTTILKFFNFLL